MLDNHQKLIAELLFNINQSYDDNIIYKLQMLRCGVFNSLFNEYTISPPNILSPTIFNLVDSEIFNVKKKKIKKKYWNIWFFLEF